jgi:hypothetical protein
VNRYAPLVDFQDPQSSYHQFFVRTTKESVSKSKRPKTPKAGKILIIGDSHVRGCASDLSIHLGKAYEVIGTVMPGSKLKNITQLAKNEIKKLCQNDCVVIWGGTNDISKNESANGLKQIINFASQTQHINIITLEAPHRHDL